MMLKRAVEARMLKLGTVAPDGTRFAPMPPPLLPFIRTCMGKRRAIEG